MKDLPIETSLSSFAELGRLISEPLPSEMTQAQFQAKCSQLQQSILNELDMYRLQVDKEELILDCARQDIGDLDRHYTDKELEIERVKQEIEELKIKLNEEKKQQQNKEQYLALAKLINQHPSRAETEQAIKLVQLELAAAEQKGKQLSQDIESRTKQFQLVLYGLEMLQNEMRIS